MKFDASTPSEAAVAPKSLQSRTLSSLVRHMSGAAFETVNFSSIDSTGSGKGSYVFKRRGKITKKKNVD